MPLKKNMTNEEVLKFCKKKPVFEQSYIKGVVVENNVQVIEMLKRPGTIVEMMKQGDLGDGVQTLTIKIISNIK